MIKIDYITRKYDTFGEVMNKYLRSPSAICHQGWFELRVFSNIMIRPIFLSLIFIQNFSCRLCKNENNEFQFTLEIVLYPVDFTRLVVQYKCSCEKLWQTGENLREYISRCNIKILNFWWGTGILVIGVDCSWLWNKSTIQNNGVSEKKALCPRMQKS